MTPALDAALRAFVGDRRWILQSGTEPSRADRAEAITAALALLAA